jgi:hypothetical protein
MQVEIFQLLANVDQHSEFRRSDGKESCYQGSTKGHATEHMISRRICRSAFPTATLIAAAVFHSSQPAIAVPQGFR